MCKIMVTTGITDKTRKKALQFIHEMARQMSSGADTDGLGYAAIDEQGGLFGERWLNNRDAFLWRGIEPLLAEVIVAEHKGMLTEEENNTSKYNSFGNVNEQDLCSITLHSRLATSGRGMVNTHPFILEESQTSLIHNGVIFNAEKLGLMKQTQCDSETILNLYDQMDVRNNISNFQKVADKLDGYYACGIFSKDNTGRVFVDIIKDSRATLSAFFIRELGTIVFATSEDNVKNACTRLGFTILAKFSVEDGAILRVDAISGEIIDFATFKPSVKKWGETYAGNSTYSSYHHGYGNYGNYPYSGRYDDDYKSEGKSCVTSSGDDDWTYDKQTEVWHRKGSKKRKVNI